MMFKSNELVKQDLKCPKVIAQRIQVSEIDMMIDPILQVNFVQKLIPIKSSKL